LSKVLSLKEIQALVDKQSLLDEIEKGFILYSNGEVDVPPVGFLGFANPPGDVHIKYGAIKDDDTYVLKMASAFYNNPQLGLEANNGLMLVFNQKTGELKLILLDEGWLTDARTAAAGAVAAKRLAPSSVDQIGIVGTGVQAKLQLEYLQGVVDCQRCVVWGRDKSKAVALVNELQSKQEFIDWGIELQAVDDIDALVSNSQLIVTTTSAKNPIIKTEFVQKGTHITAMGSDDHGKQELQSSLLAKADVVVADSVSQCIDPVI